MVENHGGARPAEATNLSRREWLKDNQPSERRHPMDEKLPEAMARVKQATSLRAFCDAKLDHANKGNPHVCPICKSGGHGTPNSDSEFHIRGERWKCFSCNNGGDIFDLAGLLIGRTEDSTEARAAQCNAVAEWAGVEGWHKDGADRRRTKATADRGEAYEWGDEAHATEDTADTKAKARADFTAFYRQAHADLMASPEALAYLHGRGITDETMRRHMLGYVASWTHPKTGKYPTKRIIMPRTASTYTARAFDETERYYSPKYAKQLVGSQLDLFNLKAARGAEVVVIVEGELDAASITQAAGYTAVGLGSISNVRSFPAKAKDVAPRAVWLVALDNDKPKEDGRNPGQSAQAELMAGMTATGLACYGVDGAELYGAYKDANEVLVADPAHLKAALDANAEKALAERDKAREAAYTATLARLRVLDPVAVAGTLYTLENAREPIPTGISGIDRALGGGLPARGLVATGAVSSVGKTTLWIQIADNLAASGYSVLFVTVEQSAEEIVSKSISRLISMTARANGGRMWASSQSVMSAKERERWTREDPEKLEALLAACETYNRIAYREDGTQALHIMEAATQPTVADIRTAAEQIAEHDGKPPIVIIDYLQLLAAEEGHERDSDKQIVDRNVMALRQMARDMNTCVSVISSLNRAGYNGSVTLESFKESGSIEYGTDVLLGLQPRGMEEELEDKAEQTAKREARKKMKDFKANERRECEICVLKNRNGRVWRNGVPLIYEAVSNLFIENEAQARAMADGEAG